MRKIRTHYSMVDCNKCCPDGGDSKTEQSHAERLSIKAMMTQGFIQSTRTPMWGDFSEIPSLDVLLNNRIKLTNLYNSLPNSVKVNVPTIDAFARTLLKGDENELIQFGLLQKPLEAKEPDPVPQPD